MKTCRSCWWYEGGRCYQKPFERLPDGRSTKIAETPCEGWESKRARYEMVFPSEMLVLVSEENEKRKGQ